MKSIPRCQVLPEAGHQVCFRIDDREVLRWHAANDYPRPYFFPVTGPSGSSLTRMGHPGAPNHDHHQSLWFAHHKVLGIDFWGNQSGATIRQGQWMAYEDGDDACRMAVELGWYDGHNPAALLKQHLVCEVRPADRPREFTLELQSRFIPQSDTLEFQQTNFGFLAVRMSRTISGHFGGGTLTSSEGAVGESMIFGKPACWMDYSGPSGRGQVAGSDAVEGISLFDHPINPGQPTAWHVREDGWMCASPTLRAPLLTTRSAPLVLRYLLLIHAGPVDRQRNDEILQQFSQRESWRIQKTGRPHTEWEIVRG